MALAKRYSYPLKWTYCAVVVMIGFFGRGYIAYWDEDWEKPLEPHQVERYVSLLRSGDEATLTKLVALTNDPVRAKRRTALYLLDRGGALGRLDRNKRVTYLARRLSFPAEYQIYEQEAGHAASDWRSREHAVRLVELWQHRAMVSPIALRRASAPEMLQELMQEDWAGPWLYAADRGSLAEALISQIGISAAGIGLGDSMNQHSRRRGELNFAVPVASWLATYTAHDPLVTSIENHTAHVRRGRALAAWWEKHGSLSSDDRDALALQALLAGPHPVGEKLPFAQWLMNRSLQGFDEQQWQALRANREDWTRLDWVIEGFGQEGFEVGEPWEGGDVEMLLGVLRRSAEAAEYDKEHAYLVANAVWLLERLALQHPPPKPVSWLGALIGYRWLEQSDIEAQTQRWEGWWKASQTSGKLRDPTEPLW